MAGPAGGPPDGMQGPPPALVRLGQVEMQELQHRVPIVGRLRELQRSTVAAEVEGKIVKLPVEEGDPVEGGKTVLAEIEETWTQLALKAATADVASAKATLDQSLLDLTQLEHLAGVSSAKPKEVADARALADSNQARYDAAVAALERVEEEVERLTILAPFTGVVTEKYAEVGEWVERGTDVIQLISSGQIDALIDVPEALVNNLDLGDVVAVRIDPLGVEREGEVVSITPLGMSSARTFPVKVRMANEDGVLKAGMSVTAEAPVGEVSHCLTVPRDAVLQTATGQQVWVALSGEGPMPAAVPVPVKVLFGAGDRYVVQPIGEAPMFEGVGVVIEGAERLFPGRPLQDADAGPRAAAE